MRWRIFFPKELRLSLNKRMSDSPRANNEEPTKKISKKQLALFYLLTFSTQSMALAAPPVADSKSVTIMKEVLVTADKEKDAVHLPAVEGTKIYSGKKTSLINLGAAPSIMNNNYRQALQKTPGLLVSEESTPLISIGYRGLSPSRAQFTQVLKDGIPIHADMFGYPEAYYTPPLQVVDHIDFLRGGASLMYGPQPGGALNYVTKDTYKDSPFLLTEENSVGSHDLYSNYTSVSGTQDAIGYYGYFHHRQSQGFRDLNSQVEVYYGGMKVVIERAPDSRWELHFDLYHETHGEPGGLTRQDFDQDPTISTRLIDHFELNRYAGSIAYEKEIDDATVLEVKGYGIYYERLSWRQRGGGFGTLPAGATASTNDIEDQAFYTGGIDARLRHDYSAFGSDEHTFTGGILYHHTFSPRVDKRGISSDSLNGDIRKDSDRTLDDVSVFIENLFKFGPLSVTPGIRFENIWQGVQENVNLDKTTVPLADESNYDFVALPGVGVNYELTDTIDVYGNYSESYRPKIFTQAVPNGTNQIVNGDLREGRSWQADAGLRGNPVPFFSWDGSFFYMEFDDQIGTVGNTTQNVGDARYEGAEIAAEVDVIKLWDFVSGSGEARTLGALKLFYNALFLDAEFTGGPNTGKTLQYAPDFIQKGGVEYSWKDKLKARLAGTFLDDHFGDDGNTPTSSANTSTFFISSYKIWDLTAEAKVYKDTVSIFGGINNIFDEHYYARVTGGGIDPADGRNYYAGVKVLWG